MADTHILPPDSTDRPPLRLTPADETLHLGTELKEEGVFSSLISSFRDLFFPVKLPPLVLESKPIPVPDRMKTKMSRSSIAGSIAIYALIILLVAWLIRKKLPFLRIKADVNSPSSTSRPRRPWLPRRKRLAAVAASTISRRFRQAICPSSRTSRLFRP